MGPERADVAVIGMGLVGAGALRHLAVAGVRAVGIGPGEPADWSTHSGAFASHYDSGRITRHLDARREWAVLAARAIAEYPAIAAASGIEFHRPVGVVLAEPDPARVEAITTIAHGLGVDLTVTPPDPTSPGVTAADGRLAFPAGSTVLSEPGPAGHIDPRRMLAAQLAAAEHLGATVVREEVRSIRVAGPGDGGGWVVRSAGGTEVVAERVVVAAGAHTDELEGLPARPVLDVRQETVVRATVGAAEQRRLEGLPSVLCQLPHHPTYDDLYLVPATDYPDGTVQLKLGATLGTRRLLPTGPDRRAWMSGDDHRHDLPALRSLLESLVPGLSAEAWVTTPCLITDTRTGLPHVEHLADGLVLAAGGNGYAAKSADAIGALAAGLVTEGRWTDTELEATAFAAVTT